MKLCMVCAYPSTPVLNGVWRTCGLIRSALTSPQMDASPRRTFGVENNLFGVSGQVTAPGVLAFSQIFAALRAGKDVYTQRRVEIVRQPDDAGPASQLMLRRHTPAAAIRRGSSHRMRCLPRTARATHLHSGLRPAIALTTRTAWSLTPKSVTRTSITTLSAARIACEVRQPADVESGSSASTTWTPFDDPRTSHAPALGRPVRRRDRQNRVRAGSPGLHGGGDDCLCSRSAVERDHRLVDAARTARAVVGQPRPPHLAVMAAVVARFHRIGDLRHAFWARIHVTLRPPGQRTVGVIDPKSVGAHDRVDGRFIGQHARQLVDGARWIGLVDSGLARPQRRGTDDHRHEHATAEYPCSAIMRAPKLSSPLTPA